MFSVLMMLQNKMTFSCFQLKLNICLKMCLKWSAISIWWKPEAALLTCRPSAASNVLTAAIQMCAPVLPHSSQLRTHMFHFLTVNLLTSCLHLAHVNRMKIIWWQPLYTLLFNWMHWVLVVDGIMWPSYCFHYCHSSLWWFFYDSVWAKSFVVQCA